ncbi:hypothetical protein [Devosia sp. 2618]|uniref:hypothetical protein n=1 Tax=Devosia sp. 2618 TaxID=3156454 RepID=UPI0033962233
MTTTKTIAAVLIGAGLMLAGGQSAWAKTKIAEETLTDTDRFALEMATTACTEGNVAELVRAMALSQVVVEHYSAETISVTRNGETKQVARGDYVFPIGMLDYSFFTPESVAAWESDDAAELTYLELEFNQSQSEQWAVDWVPVRWEGESEGEDPGDVAIPIGQPGTLLFQPVGTCWQLDDDFVAAE